jgi:hypothetical protein
MFFRLKAEAADWCVCFRLKAEAADWCVCFRLKAEATDWCVLPWHFPRPKTDATNS